MADKARGIHAGPSQHCSSCHTHPFHEGLSDAPSLYTNGWAPQVKALYDPPTKLIHAETIPNSFVELKKQFLDMIASQVRIVKSPFTKNLPLKINSLQRYPPFKDSLMSVYAQHSGSRR